MILLGGEIVVIAGLPVLWWLHRRWSRAATHRRLGRLAPPLALPAARPLTFAEYGGYFDEPGPLVRPRYREIPMPRPPVDRMD